MENKLKLLCIFILLGCYHVGLAADWQIIWQDEFNGNLSSDWTFDIGYGNWGWGNDEWQYYTSDNASIEDSCLIIRATSDGTLGKRDESIKSAKLKTQNHFSFRYGKIEARIKLPRGKGFWPAFWMLGSNITSVGWPASGEIDIMENINGESTIHGTAHWDQQNLHDSYGCHVDHVDTDEFHVYTVVWDEHFLRWELDGKQYCSLDITSPDLDEFRKNFYIILNLAVGGTWPGNPDATTNFPAEMIVDYVRVYELVGPKIGVYPEDFKFKMEKAGALEVAPETITLYNVGSDTLDAVIAETDVNWMDFTWMDNIGNDQTLELSLNQNANDLISGTHRAKLILESSNASAETSYVGLQVGKNLVLNNIARASSIEQNPPNDENVNPRNVNDGDKSTRWSSEWSDPQWISLDLNRILLDFQFSVESVILSWDSAYADEYEIQISNTSDFSSYDVIAKVSDGDGAIDFLETDNSIAGRYIRMYGLSRATEYGYSLFEFEVYGGVVTDLAEKENIHIPQEYKIQNAPNPFNNNTTIYYTLKKKQEIKIEVYDVTGKLVKKLISRVQDAGKHKITFNADQLASGLYIYRLVLPGESLTRKMLLLK